MVAHGPRSDVDGIINLNPTSLLRTISLGLTYPGYRVGFGIRERVTGTTVGVGVLVGVAVLVGVGVLVDFGVGVLVGFGVGVFVGGTGVGVLVGVDVGVLVGGTGVGVLVAVGVGVRVAVGLRIERVMV